MVFTKLLEDNMLFSYVKYTTGYLKGLLNIDARTFSVSMAFLLGVFIIMLPEASFAQSANIVANAICNIVKELQGPVARGVAAFGIIFLGFSLFLGKISWGVALALGIGIGAIFGANEIVDLIAGDEGTGKACQ